MQAPNMVSLRCDILESDCKVCMMNHFDDTQWKTLLIPSFWPSRARTVHPGTWHCTPRPFGGPFFEGRHTPPLAVWEHPLLQQHHDPHRPPPHDLLHLSIHRYLSLHQGGSIITNTSWKVESSIITKDIAAKSARWSLMAQRLLTVQYCRDIYVIYNAL